MVVRWALTPCSEVVVTLGSLTSDIVVMEVLQTTAAGWNKALGLAKTINHFAEAY